MSRKIIFALIISLLAVPVFAQYDTATGEIANTIRNNNFYLESIRLTRLAQETFDYGDYDASADFAEEAIRYAQLSNEYIADQLVSEAARLQKWANSNDVSNAYPYDYDEGRFYYERSVIAQAAGDWDTAIASAVKSIEIFTILQERANAYVPPSQNAGSGSAYIPPYTPPSQNIESGNVVYLPSQYTVRTWAVSRDCLWNIAGYSWVYGDPFKWKILYEANKSRMPDPNNPDLIVPGMILEIPSINSEYRQGMWDSTKTY